MVYARRTPVLHKTPPIRLDSGQGDKVDVVIALSRNQRLRSGNGILMITTYWLSGQARADL
jgi:hypothetical protein